MYKIPSLGARTIAFLIGLLIMNIGLFGAGKLFVKKQPLLFPPEQVDMWRRQPGNPPMGDVQRDSPLEASEQYVNGDDTITAHFARVLTFNALRTPEHYLVDSDGRIGPDGALIMKYNDKPAFTLCVIQGINQNVIAIHWLQAPGGKPQRNMADDPSNSIRAIGLKKPYYVCDAWIPVRPQVDPRKAKELMQEFANAMADTITSAR